jgi:hypothetical protein
MGSEFRRAQLGPEVLDCVVEDSHLGFAELQACLALCACGQRSTSVWLVQPESTTRPSL